MKYDIEGFAKELETDIESIGELFSSYITEMKEETEELKKNLEISDWIMLERVIHNIKGVSINLGITDVHAEAEKLDNQLKQNYTADAEEFVAKIIDLIKDSEKEIRSFFSSKGIEI